MARDGENFFIFFKEPSYIAGGNASRCNHYGKKFGGVLKI
jgi:hypothetical protein